MRVGKLVFIFKVHVRHVRYGCNWASYTLAARNADEALRRVKKYFTKQEKLEYLEVLASTAD